MVRDKVELAVNVPVNGLQLRYPNGKMMEDRGFGPSVMYSTTDDRVLFVDLETSLRIMKLGLQPGECFCICKQKQGKAPARLNVWLSPATEQMRAQKEQPPEPPSQLQRQLEETAANVVEGKHPATPRMPIAVARRLQATTETGEPPATPPWVSTLVANTNYLVDAYAAALQHANSIGNHVKPEDVRALLTTAYINLSRSGGNSNAA